MGKSESVFAELLFQKYEEAMVRLHDARRQRYLAEVEVKNTEEMIEFLNFRIAHQQAHELRLLQNEKGTGEKP